MKDKDHANTILVCKSEGESSLRRLRLQSEDNAKMYLEAAKCNFVDWIHLFQDEVRCWVFLNTYEFWCSIKGRV
jgi:hypothetical protein